MSDWWSADPVADAPKPSRYSAAISSIESAGEREPYRALGPITKDGDRAFGKHQVMGKNIGPWTEEILGRRMTPREFLFDDDAQDKVFEGKFGEYVQKHGEDGAARAWFAGEGGMNNPNRRDQLGTSVADYSRKFTGALGYADEGPTRTAQRAAPQAEWWKADPVATPQQAQGGRAGREGDLDAKPANDVSIGASILHGLGQGATANFGDEIGAAMDVPVSALIGGKFGEEYEKNLKARRERSKTVQEANPGSFLTGEIGGAVALPVGKVLQAATLPGRIGRSAAVGAGYGAASGVGAGEDVQDRATRGVTGAGVGLLAGAAAPPVLAGVGAAVSGIGALARPVTTAIRGIRDPEAEAARRVTSAISRDANSASSGLTPGEFVTAKAEGTPVSVMDLGGATTRSVARSAANTSPEGRAALDRTINDRFEGQSERVTGWLNDNFNFPNAQALDEAIGNAARTVNRNLYAKAYRDGLGGVWDNELSAVSQAPLVQDAVKAAIKQVENRTASGRAGRILSQDGKPTLEFWDLVKKQIDQEINVAKRAGRREDVMEMNDIKSLIVKKLDAAVPSYADARAGASGFFGAENALEAGQKFVTQNFENRATRQALAKMTPEERELFQAGFVSRFIETLEKTGDRRNVLNQITQSKAAREKLELAIGKNKADEMEAMLRVEGIMDLARGAVQGNSNTARQLVELGLAGGAYGVSGGDITNLNTSALMNAALVYGAARGKGVIDQRVSRKVAEMLASSNPTVLRKGISIVARNNRLLDGLRNTDTRLAAIGGQQSRNVPALQAPGAGRAEDDQP